MSKKVISVRHGNPSDSDAIRKIYSGTDAIAGTLQLPYPSKQLWEERLTKPSPGIITLVAEIEEVVAGHIVLSANQNQRRRHAGYIGMAVSDEYARQGVGSALMEAVLDMADNWLGLSRVELTVFTDNTAAIKLYEKFGFSVEGEAVNFAFRAGEYCNALYMARLK